MTEVVNLNDPEHAIPNRELTPLHVRKWDNDIKTISSLYQLAQEVGGVLVLQGGMAAEAYTGGIQRRAHNDIDATLYLDGDKQEPMLQKLKHALESEDTRWSLYNQKLEKIEYREDDDNKEFFDRRRLELHLKSGRPEKYQVRRLINSKGEVFDVNVVDLPELVAGKIRKLFMVNDKPEQAERQTNLSDYTDLESLLKSPDLKEDQVIGKIAEILQRYRDHEDAMQEAEREYEFVVGLLAQIKK